MKVLTDNDINVSLLRLNGKSFQQHVLNGLVIYTKREWPLVAYAEYGSNETIFQLGLEDDMIFPPHVGILATIGKEEWRMARLDDKTFSREISSMNKSLDEVSFNSLLYSEGDWGLVLSPVDP